MSHISTALLKIALGFTLLFAACIGLIRAQPYDDSALRAFLTPPEGCPMPCFMGIRPGVTTADEALAIFEAHEGAREMYLNSNGESLVDLLTVRTAYSLGDVWLLWGKPDTIGYTTRSEGIFGPIHLVYRMIYSHYQTEIIGGTMCPYIPTLWRSEVSLYIGATERIFIPVQTTYSNNDPFLDYVVELKHDTC